MKKVVVALSGGMDSTAVFARALREQRTILQAVGFRYGSKHNRWENDAARSVAAAYGVPFVLMDISAAMTLTTSNLLLTGGGVPEGYYEAETMRQTVVPGRNSIFISILASVAESIGADEVWLGIHSGDHHIYPDCRPGFYAAMKAAIEESTLNKVTLAAPYLFGDKKSILAESVPMGVPFGLTRTCYKDQPVACGRCGSCQERLAAYASLGWDDPVAYESREPIPAE